MKWVLAIVLCCFPPVSTEWHNVIAFGKLGEFAATLVKGAHIEVEGSLSSGERIMETREGNPTIRTFLGSAESIRKLDRAESARESHPS